MKRLTREEDRRAAERLVKVGWGKVRKYKGQNAVVMTKKGREGMKAMLKWFDEFWKIAPKDWKKMMAEEEGHEFKGRPDK